MNLKLKKGTRPQNTDEVVEEPPVPIATAKDQVGSSLAARAASASLAACLVVSPLGLIAGGLALAQVLTSRAPAPVAVVDQANDRALASEAAQDIVVTWLTTTSSQADRLTSRVKGTSVSSLPREAFTVAAPSIAGIDAVDATTWSVVVAVTVTDSRGVTSRRFYQVPVQVVDGGMAVLTLPTPVTGPGRLAATSTSYSQLVDRTGSAGQTVEQFLAAYAAGQGDVTRYLTPSVALPPIVPAPYTAVQLTELRATAEISGGNGPADGDSVRVLATAKATVTEEQSLQVVYALTLTARAGRWEISAIDLAPALSKTPATPVAGAVVGQATTATPSPSASVTAGVEPNS